MGKQQEDETNSLDKNSSAPVNKLAQEMWKPSADPIHTFCFSTRFWCRRATCSSYCKSTQQQGTALQTVHLAWIKHTLLLYTLQQHMSLYTHSATTRSLHAVQQHFNPITTHCATTQSLHIVQQHGHYMLCNNTITTHCATTQSLHTVQQHSHYTLYNNTVTTCCATTQSLHTVQQHSHYTLCNNTVTTHCATTRSLHAVQQHSHYTLCNNTVTTHCATTRSLHAAQQHFNPITPHCATTCSPHAVQQQFSSNWYLRAQKSPYVLNLISLKFSQQRLRLT